jgi:hypothetical protein
MEPIQDGPASGDGAQESDGQQLGEGQQGDGPQQGDGLPQGGGQLQGDDQQLSGEGNSKAARSPSRSRQPIQVRVLVDCEHGKPNDVVELPVGVARAAAIAGQVDPDESAVEYALSLKK